METIKEAKEYVRKNMLNGVQCPCCKQFAKMYKRKLNAGMARTLIQIYKHHRGQFVNVKQFLREHGYQNSHDWTLLRYWGLMEEKLHEEKDGALKSSGVWRVTPKGIAFILENELIELREYVYVYNSGFYGFAGKITSIEDALGRKFNYNELMAK